MDLTDALNVVAVAVLAFVGYSHFSLALYLKRNSENNGLRALPTTKKTKPSGKPGVIVRTEAQEAEIEERMMAKKGWDATTA